MRILLAPKFKPSLFGEKFPKDLLEDLKEYRSRLECNYVSFWSPPAFGKYEKKGSQGTIVSTYPLTWVQQYTVFGYSAVDPVIVDGLQSNSPLFFDYHEEPRPERKKFYAAVRRAQLGQFSLTIPIHFSSELRSTTTFMFSASHNRHNIEKHENLVQCREYAHHIASSLLQNESDAADAANQLTDREIAILKGLSNGNSYKQVGEILGISRWTVIAHAKSAKTKLGAKSNPEAVSIAVSKGIL